MYIRIKERGFTLVEIMIVVAIIGLLAAIAVPNLLRSRINSNEGAIKYDLRTFSSANESYRAATRPLTYAAAITDLTTSAAGPAYIDTSWEEATKHGFTIAGGYTQNSASSYTMVVAPVSANDATNTYCVDHSGTIFGTSGGANPANNVAGCTGGAPILG